MKKALFAVACAIVMTGCAEMPQQAQGEYSQPGFKDEEPITGSRLPPRRAAKPAPQPPAGG